jgi:phage tail-like protein
MNNDNLLAPLHVFRFQVDFREDPLSDGGDGSQSDVVLCSGAFAECTGLEATMEPKVIAAGGRNYGPAQRVGPVTFATVVLKRGMTSTRHLWTWFEMVSTGAYAYRLSATLTMFDTAGEGVVQWQLTRALPIKFKAADLNARGTEVGIEELHLAHEGLTLNSRPGISLYD